MNFTRCLARSTEVNKREFVSRNFDPASPYTERPPRYFVRMALDLSTTSAAKLEPFLLMAKAAKGAGAAKLIQDATAAQGVFVFGELLDMPNISQVSTPLES